MSSGKPIGKIKYKAIERSQCVLQVLDYEQLISADHPARIIWELAGKMNLEAFAEQAKSREGEVGRSRWSPQLLVSVWVYSYTLRIASARAIERLMTHEPGLRWLTADQEVNHHTLADFRVEHKAALEKLFVEFLAMLDQAGVVDLQMLLQDGTKMKAVAGKSSFHRRKTLEKRLRTARKVMKKLEREAAQEGASQDERRQAAQRNAAQQAVKRATAALKQLEKLEAKAAPSAQADLRVSDSEPEARKMKQTNGGWDPGYNMQVITEAQSRIIVNVGVTNEGNDLHQLGPALDRMAEQGMAAPQTMIADNGYATRENVECTAERKVELIAPWKDDLARQAGSCTRHGIDKEFAAGVFQKQARGQQLLCPAGKTLTILQQKVHHGMRQNVFQAQARDCSRCPWLRQCCGQRGGPRRIEVPIESKAMRDYLARMKRRAVKKLYKKRAEVAEFPNLWIKGVQQLRRFSVRGLVKVGIEALWIALAYNISQWIRLRPLLA